VQPFGRSGFSRDGAFSAKPIANKFAPARNQSSLIPLTWPLDITPLDAILYSRIANRECVMTLKPQDVLFLLKLVALDGKPWSFNKLSVELGMSPSEVHAAAKRAIAARLAVRKNERISPNIRSLEDFLLHGIQYVFVAERGEQNRGMPTAYAATPLDAYFDAADEPPPVWPDPAGEVRGESFSPLYKSAPTAARNDPELYELLALLDAIRGGRARERDIARKELKKRLERYGKSPEP
jgi:hypothetical protein